MLSEPTQRSSKPTLTSKSAPSVAETASLSRIELAQLAREKKAAHYAGVKASRSAGDSKRNSEKGATRKKAGISRQEQRDNQRNQAYQPSQQSEKPCTVYKALPHQLKVFQSQKRYVFLGAGVGSGKTDVGSLWILQKIKDTPPGGIGLIAANSYTQLIDSTLRNLYKNWQKFGVKYGPATLPRAHGPFNIQVWNGKYWVEILCRSLDSYSLLAGIEIGWAWLDEVFLTSKSAIDVVMARLRDDRMHNQMLLTTTLDEPNTWMYKTFVENYLEEFMDVFYATTIDNKKNLPDGYIESLQATYSPKMYERMVLAHWVMMEGSKVYYSFDRALHVTNEAVRDEHLPVLWAFDFNIGEGKPMSSCLCQIKKGESLHGELRLELHVFDEIILETSDTNDSIVEYEARYGQKKSNVVIYGDASGRARDTRSKTTDYLLLKDRGFIRQKVPRGNPAIRNRHNSVNSLMKSANGDVRLKIHPNCKVLIQGLETVMLKSGSSYLEMETYHQHVTTALGYLIMKEFPIYRKYKDNVKFWK